MRGLKPCSASAGPDGLPSDFFWASTQASVAFADFADMNAVWEEWIPEDALPTRATVEANLAAENILVEIAVQAAVGD